MNKSVKFILVRKYGTKICFIIIPLKERYEKKKLIILYSSVIAVMT